MDFGISYPPDTDWQRAFELAFPYEETPDQLEVNNFDGSAPTGGGDAFDWSRCTDALAFQCGEQCPQYRNLQNP